jgi:hypothetical protein
VFAPLARVLLRVIQVFPAIPTRPVRPKSGRKYSRFLIHTMKLTAQHVAVLTATEHELLFINNTSPGHAVRVGAREPDRGAPAIRHHPLESLRPRQGDGARSQASLIGLDQAAQAGQALIGRLVECHPAQRCLLASPIWLKRRSAAFQSEEQKERAATYDAAVQAWDEAIMLAKKKIHRCVGLPSDPCDASARNSQAANHSTVADPAWKWPFGSLPCLCSRSGRRQ